MNLRKCVTYVVWLDTGLGVALDDIERGFIIQYCIQFHASRLHILTPADGYGGLCSKDVKVTELEKKQ